MNSGWSLEFVRNLRRKYLTRQHSPQSRSPGGRLSFFRPGVTASTFSFHAREIVCHKKPGGCCCVKNCGLWSTSWPCPVGRYSFRGFSPVTLCVCSVNPNPMPFVSRGDYYLWSSRGGRERGRVAHVTGAPPRFGILPWGVGSREFLI